MQKALSTYEKVFESADNLLARGQRPTQQLIRNELGSGSLTTINKALNDWWQQLGKRLQEQSSRPEIPEPVFDSANTLWQQALAYAEHQFSSDRAALELKYSTLVSELKQQGRSEKDEHKRLQSLSDKLLGENRKLLETISELQEKQLLQDEVELRLSSENRDLIRQQKELELTLERVAGAENTVSGQELLEYKHKNQYLEDENARLIEHSKVLQDENRELRDQLFESERKWIKDKHQLELVINQQDLKHKELEARSESSADAEESRIKARLDEKDREINRLLELLKHFNKDS